MFKRALCIGFLLSASLTSGLYQAQAEELLIQKNVASDESATMSQPIRVSSNVVKELARAGQFTSYEQVTEAEAIERAKELGIELKKTPFGSHSRPWFIVKAGVGLPGLLDAAVEIFVNDHITVEGSVGIGLLPTLYSAAVRWRPDATCWGCGGKNVFSIGFGPEFGVMPIDHGVDFILTATADAQYIHRFADHFGWVMGLKLGLGATTEYNSHSYNTGFENPPGVEPGVAPAASDTTTGSWTKVEPALVFMLYTGFQF